MIALDISITSGCLKEISRKCSVITKLEFSCEYSSDNAEIPGVIFRISEANSSEIHRNSETSSESRDGYLWPILL